MTGSQRLFFALWPPVVVRNRIEGLARRVAPRGAHRVPRHNFHITLAFVGAVDAAVRDEMRAAAAAVRAEPFELVLERIGSWPKPRIQWLAPARPHVILSQLAADLQQALRPCGFIPEHRPYQAHVTLARKVGGEHPVEPVAPIHWPVRDFVLVHSISEAAGPRYQVIDRWPLLAPDLP